MTTLKVEKTGKSNDKKSIRLTFLRESKLWIGDDVAQPLSHKDAALLAVLALDGAVARNALAQMLWPEADLAHALTSLRQRRFRLRRSTGIDVIEGEDTLRISSCVSHPAREPDSWLELDLTALDGQLLEGLDLSDSPDFADWLELARERWRVQRSQALARIAASLEAKSQWEPALEIATRLANDESLSEHAHRRLMRLHYLHGDLGAALDVYRRLAERLDAELGELPDDETAALAASLRIGQSLAPTRKMSAVPPTLRRPPRLVGRDLIWGALEKSYAERRSVVIEGAPGVGKSRLLEDYFATLDSSNVLLLSTRAGDRHRPYALLMQLISRLWFNRGALRMSGEKELPQWARSELAALFPELGPAPARADTARLHRAVSLALTQANVALIGIDDVQQADEATVEMFPLLIGEELPLWLFASRAGELPPTLTTWLGGAAAPRHLHLTPLSADAVGQLLSDLDLPGIHGDGWAVKLARHTGGLPLFVLEVLRRQYEQPAEDFAAQPLSNDVSQIVRGRFASLPEAARQLAQAGAVLRAPLSLDAGIALYGGRPDEWVAAFRWLEASQWLDGTGRIHDLVSVAIRESMPVAERRWIHGRIASWLVQQAAAPQDCAQHFEEAGRDADAAPLFEAAALAARKASRPAEEASLFERAAAAWERAGLREKQFAALHESVAPRSYASGTVAAILTAECLMNLARSPLERALALTKLAGLRTDERRFIDCLPLAKEAMVLAEAIGDATVALRAASMLILAMGQNGQQDDAMALLERMRPVADAASPEARRDYLAARLHACWSARRLADGADVSREMIVGYLAENDLSTAAICAGNLAWFLHLMGHMNEAWQVTQQALVWQDTLGEISTQTAASAGLGSACFGIGRIGSAIAAFERALASQQLEKLPVNLVVQYENWLADCHLMRNDPIAAQRVLQTPIEPSSQLLVSNVSRRHLLLARFAVSGGADPGPELRRAREALGAAAKPADYLNVDIESARFGADRGDPAKLHRLEQSAHAIEQGALAMRVAWWRVDAMRRLGDVTAAGQLARELLAQPLWPSRLLPCHWLWIAYEALNAACDPEAASIAERARAAYAEMLADLAALPGPPAQWSADVPY